MEHLRKEAKAVLAAQKAGRIDGCRMLRQLGRLSDAGEAELLQADVSLQDVQMAVALEYGFASWTAMKTHVESLRAADAPDADAGPAVRTRAVRLFKQLRGDPLHQRSQMWALMVALHFAGRDEADYAALTAVSGWSGQFVYIAKPGWPTFIEPCPTVQRACAAVGMGVEERQPSSADEAFDFVRDACEAGRPVLAEHLEYGLFVGADDGDEPKVQFFVDPFFVDGVWWTREQFTETWWNAPQGDRRLFRLTGAVAPREPDEVARETLAQIVHLAEDDYWTGWRNSAAPGAVTGLRGIEQYAADVADPSKRMTNADETDGDSCFFDRGWGCYAVYPQWTARECTARYLEATAGLFDGEADRHLRGAVGHYHNAYGAWRRWERHLGRPQALGGYDQRWADPDHRRTGSDAVLEALEHERRGVESIKEALSAVG